MWYLCAVLETGEPFSGTIPAGPVVNGSVSGTAVNFDLSSGNWHNAAVFHDDPIQPYMTGTLTVQLNLAGIGAVTVSGDWGVPIYCLAEDCESNPVVRRSASTKQAAAR
jgi:hypothetical protein